MKYTKRVSFKKIISAAAVFFIAGGALTFAQYNNGNRGGNMMFVRGNMNPVMHVLVKAIDDVKLTSEQEQKFKQLVTESNADCVYYMEEGQHNMQGGQHNMQGGQHNMQGGQHNMQGSKDGRKGRVGNREDCTKNGMGYDVSGDNHRVLKDLFLKEKLTESDVTAALDKIHAEGDLNNEMRTWFNDFAVKAHAILNKEQRQKVAAEIKSEADDNFGEGFFSNWRGERRTNNIKFRLTADLTLNADQQKLLDNMLADFQTTRQEMQAKSKEHFAKIADLFSKDTLKAEDLNAGADKMYTDIKTVFSKQIKPAVAFHNSLNAQQKQLLADRVGYMGGRRGPRN